MRRRSPRSIVLGLAVFGLGLAGCTVEDLGLRDTYTGEALLQPDKVPYRVRRDAYGDPVPQTVDGANGRFLPRAYHHKSQ